MVRAVTHCIEEQSQAAMQSIAAGERLKEGACVEPAIVDAIVISQHSQMKGVCSTGAD